MSLRSFESSKDLSEDCLKNYDIVKKLDGGVLLGVYLATCKRGRLKRRSVVLKKVPATDNLLGSVAVHQALCHPTLLSLFSTFSVIDPDAESEQQPQTRPGAPTAMLTRYIVLEHCGQHGTLSDHLPRLNLASTSPLEDTRIRGVVKTLADALAYLEKENVVHKRLIPESVYITEDFRVKLGGFDAAVRISPGGVCMSLEVGDPQYHLAPEIKAGLQYDCSSDLWSLGSLILWMLDPSRESAPRFDTIRPKGDLGTLVSRLLEKAPERRLKARSLYSHPFLDPKLPVQNLDPNPRLSSKQRDEARRSDLGRTRELELNHCNQEAAAVPRKPFGELTNRRYPLRRGLEGDGDRAVYLHEVTLATGPSTSRLPRANRRVFSDPVHGTGERRKFLDPIKEADNESASDEKPTPTPRVRFRSKSATVLPRFLETRGRNPTIGDNDSNDQVEDSSLDSSLSILGAPKEGEVVKSMDDGVNMEELLGDFEAAFRSPLPSLTLRQAALDEPPCRTKAVIDTLVPVSHSTPAAVKSNPALRRVSSPPVHLPQSEPPCHPFDDPPFNGTDMPRPKPFNTFSLPPQTHRVARGQLVVLPSRTLLVDFREGERRQGRQGAEVLTISPDGEEIRVFSAPRMSSPCCLVEPSAIYNLGALPKPYWKLHSAAGKLIEQIKQHIPRLILYDSDSKFTLMTNSPDADVEVLFYSSEDNSKSGQNGGETSNRTNGSFPLRTVTMRIKVMRSRQLIEISRQVFTPARVHDRALKPSSGGSPPREKEGEWKKVVLVAPGGSIDSVDRTSLDGYERKGLERTGAFLAVCRTVEGGLVEDIRDPLGDISCGSGSPPSVLVCKTLPVDQHDSSIPGELKSVGLTRKLGHSLTATVSIPSVGWYKGCHQFPFEPPSLTRQPGNFETRFIPSVGWCVRYAGPSGGAGRYRMMFFDGKTLEVDVDEECVELMDSVRDEIVRYKIRECGSRKEIMEKMCAFKEFVSMFDDEGSGLE